MTLTFPQRAMAPNESRMAPSERGHRVQQLTGLDAVEPRVDQRRFNVEDRIDSGEPPSAASPSRRVIRPSDAADRQFLQVLIDEAAR